MPIDRELAVGGSAVAILGIPAYMGWVGHSFGAFITYAVVAGVALAAADRLTVSNDMGESAKVVLQHAMIRTAGVAVVGGFMYAVAQIVF